VGLGEIVLSYIKSFLTTSENAQKQAWPLNQWESSFSAQSLVKPRCFASRFDSTSAKILADDRETSQCDSKPRASTYREIALWKFKLLGH
jgi:hypothetical protein